MKSSKITPFLLGATVNLAMPWNFWSSLIMDASRFSWRAAMMSSLSLKGRIQRGAESPILMTKLINESCALYAAYLNNFFNLARNGILLTSYKSFYRKTSMNFFYSIFDKIFTRNKKYWFKHIILFWTTSDNWVTIQYLLRTFLKT